MKQQHSWQKSCSAHSEWQYIPYSNKMEQCPWHKKYGSTYHTIYEVGWYKKALWHKTCGSTQRTIYEVTQHTIYEAALGTNIQQRIAYMYIIYEAAVSMAQSSAHDTTWQSTTCNIWSGNMAQIGNAQGTQQYTTYNIRMKQKCLWYKTCSSTQHSQRLIMQTWMLNV